MLTPRFSVFSVLAIFCILFFSGCGSGKYIIEYTHDPTLDKVPIKSHQLNMAIAPFSDKRPPEEKLISVRSKQGQPDTSDYTYDNEFEDGASVGISDWMVKHLDDSKAFQRISHAPFTSDNLSDSNLDTLHAKGIDAVMVGDINHFYACYHTNTGLLIVYGTFLALPSAILVPLLAINVSPWYWFLEPIPAIIPGYLESLPSRNIKYATQFTARMISTSTHKILWEGSFEESRQFYGKMPPSVVFPNKYICATYSLRQAVNKMVKNLSSSDIESGQILKVADEIPLGQEKVGPIMKDVQENDRMKVEEEIPKGLRNHYGFFTSIAAGFATGNITLDANNATIKKGEISGTGLQTTIKIGGVVSQESNLILSLDLLIGTYSSPTFIVDDHVDNVQTNLSAYEIMYGIGVTKYFMPSNTFLSATVGIGDFDLAITDKAKSGFAIQIECGKEWGESRAALGRMGIAAGLKYISAENQPHVPIYAGTLSALRFYVVFNVSFNKIE